ncbi:adenylate kinase [Ferrimonas sp.]|uniref:adenylate kinase n=1 Tax=Ferrimonas sp. TaxID=2080861 RepID=UPI003A8EF6C8
MKKVVVIGKPGSGKSTLSRQLSQARAMPLYPLDSILYHPDGSRRGSDDYTREHDLVLRSERWIIDGFGTPGLLNKQIEHADTVIYIDLPYPISYWLVTKRMLKGAIIKPKGWPEGSSVIKGSIQSYKTLRLCPGFWNEKFLVQLKARCEDKALHVIRSLKELEGFSKQVIKQT